MDRVIDAYTKDGWTFLPDPIEWPDSWTDAEQDVLLEKAGYHKQDEYFGDGETGRGVALWQSRDNKVLLCLSSIYASRMIYCENFGLAVECLGKLAPLCGPTYRDDLIIQICELLTTYGEEGPLQACLDRKNREDRLARQERKARLAAQKT